MPHIYERLGKKLRVERDRLGWTQEELAEKAGLHAAFIGQIERNKKKVSLDTVEKLACALNVSPGFLLNPNEPQKLPTWESRIDGLLRDRTPADKKILYTTLRQLARSIQKSR